MDRKATAVWRGTAKKGRGELTTESRALSEASYAFSSRFEDERGTNPEELIAAAHAGCFAMALALQLQEKGHEPAELKVDATVTVEKQGGGFAITRSALKLNAQVPGIEKPDFEELAQAAKQGCPVSKVLNAEIELDWSLA